MGILKAPGYLGTVRKLASWLFEVWGSLRLIFANECVYPFASVFLSFSYC